MEEKIIDSFKINDIERHYDYEVRKTNITRKRVFFALLPIWIKSKFRWLKHIEVLERKYYSRKKEFDGGMTYQFYWSKWKEEWRIEKIIK